MTDDPLRELTEADNIAIIALRETHSAARVAALLGVTKNRITARTQTLISHGRIEKKPNPTYAPRIVTPKPLVVPKAFWTEEARAGLRDLVARGGSIEDALRLFPARARPTLYREMRKLGLRFAVAPKPERVVAPKPERPKRAPAAPRKIVTNTRIYDAPPSPPRMIVEDPTSGTDLPVRGNCQWAHGSRPPWRFCESPAIDGTWCAEHRERVYVKAGGVAA